MDKNLIVYNASAGSGKTYTLVLEYLKLCLEYPANGFKRSLAITFTNKAAEELATRVISSLTELSKPNSTHDYLDSLTKHFEISELELQERAKEALQNILHDYSNLAISTIDSFTTKLLRPFALDLGLPPEYEISLREKEIQKEIAKRVLRKSIQEKEINDVIVRWIEQTASNEKKTLKIGSSLERFIGLYFSENSRFSVLELKNSGVLSKGFNGKALFEKEKAIREQYKELGKQILEFMKLNALDIDHFKGKSRSGIIGLLGNLQGGSAPVFTSNTEKMFSNGEYFQKGLESLNPEFHNILSRVDDLNNTFGKDLILFEELNKNLIFIDLARIIDKELEQYNRETNTVLLKQISGRISEIIENNPTPFIFERIGARYSNILIDEFQDTSVIQWQNLLPLIANCLSTNGKVILVGDPKQAIYRFRGGELMQMVSLPDINPDPYPEKNKLLKPLLAQSIKKEGLKSNFRSGKNIVEFNNSLLQELAPFLGEPLSAYYKEGIQQAAQDFPGMVRVFFPDDGESKANFTSSEIGETHYENFLKSSVLDAHAAGVPLSDICVLCFSKKEIIRFRNFLEKEGIPSTTADDDLLLLSPDILFFRKVLEFKTHPLNREKAFDALNQLKIISPQIDLQKIWLDVHEQQTPITKNYKSEILIDFFGLDYSREPAHEIIQLSERFLIETQTSTFSTFLELINNYTEKNGSWSPGLIDFLSNEEDELRKNESRDNAVQFLTMHKSKGLDFQTVILPLLDPSKNKSNPEIAWMKTPRESLIVDYLPSIPVSIKKMDGLLTHESHANFVADQKHKSLIDDTNLLYVSLTRAVRNLCICAPKNKSNEIFGFFRGILERKLNPDEQVNFTYQIGEWSFMEGRKIEESEYSVTVNNKKPTPNSFPLIPHMHSSASKRGELLHELFGYYIPGSSFDGYHKKLPTTLATQITTDELKEFHQNLAQLLDAELTEPVEQTLVEREFIHENEILRPDRIDISQNKVLVSDLKTGQSDASHINQIKAYLRCASLVFKKETLGVLIYTDSKEKVLIHEY
ncbi:UvrD-helicase domain-containing protein [Luteibaculum oceani]|uniref:DNA 3'-5' helicase n=1 Tax=Luteibaculum oceani TaxID=1294296 RepID=A0A5C6V9P5_9FLAO|nr:UvrD-helicase domain-containing protein [Luteibaculum oceani]TXC81500.1 AAA family ATPase [Luteibaculum oceani]